MIYKFITKLLIILKVKKQLNFKNKKIFQNVIVLNCYKTIK